MSIADQVAPVGRADLEVKVDRVVLAGQAPIKRGSLVVLSKVARGASRRTARRTANSSRKVIRPVRSRLPTAAADHGPRDDLQECEIRGDDEPKPGHWPSPQGKVFRCP
jgi:hypothetical protein